MLVDKQIAHLCNAKNQKSLNHFKKKFNIPEVLHASEHVSRQKTLDPDIRQLRISTDVSIPMVWRLGAPM